ncbi:MAG: alpha/beta fold hydrolase [Bacteroidales bacterium]|nr:alpha/beta fold hydrolase [Bacteroidales bacterium]
MKLFHRIEGKGEPLVILHGLYGSADNWYKIASFLLNDYTIILPDFRNHGRSPHSEEFGIDIMADDIKLLIEDLNFSKVSIMGHSMGGKVAMAFASRYPDLIERLIVVDVSPFSYKNESSFMPQLEQHQSIMNALLNLDVDNIQKREEADVQLSSDIRNALVRQFLLKNLKRKDGSGFYWQVNLKVLASKLSSLLMAGDIVANKELTMPTLFIKGEKSIYMQEEQFVKIKEVFPQAKFKIIMDAGHWVHAEQTDEFVKCVREFLDKN